MLVTCPDCKTRVSDEAESCPHCGYPEPGPSSTERLQACNDEIAAWESKRGQRLVLDTYSTESHCVSWPSSFIGSPTKAEVDYLVGYRTKRFARCENCGKELPVIRDWGPASQSSSGDISTGPTGSTGPGGRGPRPRGREANNPSTTNFGWLWTLFIFLMLVYPAAQVIKRILSIF